MDCCIGGDSNIALRLVGKTVRDLARFRCACKCRSFEDVAPIQFTSGKCSVIVSVLAHSAVQ